jgi:hypothetical protein
MARLDTDLTRTQWALLVIALAGLGLAAVGHSSGPRWLGAAGLLLAFGAFLWLYAVERPKRDGKARRRGDR